jgi:hypothetical protein
MQKICRNCKYRDLSKYSYVDEYYGCNHDAIAYENTYFPSSGIVIDEAAGGPWFGPEFGCVHFESATEASHGDEPPAETVDVN